MAMIRHDIVGWLCNLLSVIEQTSRNMGSGVNIFGGSRITGET